MPRVTRLRVGALEEIAEQLRFAPRARILKVLDAVEALAGEIDAERNYPASWLVFRLTGYRPDTGDDTTLVGGALLSELSAMSERVSHAAGIDASEIGDALALGELCERWSVNRKTLERARRKGLVARRVKGPDGRGRLVFTRSAVEMYEGRHARELRRAGSFERIDAQTAARMVRRARVYRARFGCTLSETATRIAQRFGRSREAVGALLRRHDAQSPSPIFGPPRTLERRERDLALRLSTRGVSTARVAAHINRSRAGAHRAINQRRAELLRGLSLEGPVAPTFHRDDAAEVLLAPPSVREGLSEPAETDAQAFVRMAREQSPPDRAVESARATALLFLRWRILQTLGGDDGRTPPASALDRAETDLRWASLLALALARSQRRLALGTIEERVGAGFLELPPGHARALHAAAMRALCDAAWRFEPASGTRLAARAAAPLAKRLSEALATLGPHRASSAQKRAQATAARLDDWTAAPTIWQTGRELVAARSRRLFDANEPLAIKALGPEAAMVVRLRRGWGDEPPMTIAEVAARLDLPPTRIAPLERRTLRVASGLAPAPSLRRR